MNNKAPKSYRIGYLFILLVIFKLVSCGGSTNNQPATAEAFKAIESELKDKFGENAYYTDLTITYNESIGNIIGVTVAEDPESLKMGQWNLTQDTWKQNSDITIEVPKGTKASDYMFQLGKTISLSKLGALVEQSIKKLKNEKDLTNPTLTIAALNFPDNGDISKAKYMIHLKSKNDDDTFRFHYKLNGNLIKMDY
ncbi:hypothetical protein FBALC1_07398 [Flavobacteriales bacterium ALC-1]|nr:hypothetical protein FBALC1_07398 [Flavobacteriales bacterium ALC-1]